MGVDYYYLNKEIEKRKGTLARKTLQEIINILDDDKPFKEQRIKRITEKYQTDKKQL